MGVVAGGLFRVVGVGWAGVTWGMGMEDLGLSRLLGDGIW